MTDPTPEAAKLLPSMRHYLNSVKARQTTGFGPRQESYEYVGIPLWQLRQWIDCAEKNPRPQPSLPDANVSSLVEWLRAKGRESAAMAASPNASNNYIEAADLLERLASQLPDGMQHCTILFKECEKGHGWLTATNWVQHPCPTCRYEAAEAELAKADAVIVHFTEAKGSDFTPQSITRGELMLKQQQQEARLRHAARQKEQHCE